MATARDLKLTHPPMAGQEVTRLQKSLGPLCQHRRLSVPRVTGTYDALTEKQAWLIVWLLGIGTKQHTHGNLTRDLQYLIEHPDKRSARQKAAAKVRWTRYKREHKKSLAERAYIVAEHLVGIMEQGGNNMGPWVSKLIRENGGVGPEAWCGDTMAYCYRHAGSKRVSRSWAAVRLIRGLVGIRATGKPRRGDLVRFDFPGSPLAHVGMFDEWLDRRAGWFKTIEGNTGPYHSFTDPNKSQDGVRRKKRHISEVHDFLHVLG